MNTRRMGRRLLISAVLGAAVLAALVAYGNARDVASSLEEFRWELAPPILGVALGNYLLRFVKWHVFLARIDAGDVPVRRSFLIFMSGLGMTVTPGKAGEWLKCYLLRELHGTPIARSTPILLAERLTDALALMLLALAGIVAFQRDAWPLVAATLLGSAVVVALSRHRRLVRRIVASSSSLPFARRLAPHLGEVTESNYRLMDPAVLALMTALSVVAWGSQVVAFHLVLAGFGVDAGPDTFLRASFILPVSTLAAGLLLVPGGLGVAETGITSLLESLLDLGRGTASAATLLIRGATLWFAVVLGLIAFAILLRSQALAGQAAEAAAASRGSSRASGDLKRTGA